MKAIKTLVVFLGVLLVAGLGLMAYGLFAKKTHTKGLAQASSPAVASEFGSVAIPIPAGSRVEQMSVAGDKVILRLSGAGPERVLVLDPVQGRVSGSFTLAPEPPAR